MKERVIERLISMIEEAYAFISAEHDIEMSQRNGDWFIMEYIPNEGLLPINHPFFQIPVVSKADVERYNIDIHSIFYQLDVYFCGD